MGVLWSLFFGSKEMRILMLGLDAAGKTRKSVMTMPTVGFNVETVNYKKAQFNVWDVGGQDKIRPLWRHYYTGTQGLIYVIDSQDKDRLEESKQELLKILADREMQNCILLVFANKQDLPNSLGPEEIKDKLGLEKMNRLWFVQPSCAKTGEGLMDGLNWLERNIKGKK